MQQYLFTVLDQVITEVARAELERLRLSEGLRDEEVPSKIRGALGELDRLQQGKLPDYHDPWVALFYLTWYQPGHILLGRQLIKLLESKGQGLGNGNIHIVDFGCGALAMQFALAWATAQAIEDGADMAPITIVSYDTSSPMIKLGISLWNQLKASVREERSLSDLSIVIDRVIQPQYLGSPPNKLIPTVKERWLVAMHTFYKETSDETSESLKGVTSRYNPSVCLFSCNKSFQSTLDDAISVDSENYEGHESIEKPETTAVLDQVTRWRGHVADQSHLVNSPRRRLENPVTWGFSDAAVRLFVRRHDW